MATSGSRPIEEATTVFPDPPMPCTGSVLLSRIPASVGSAKRAFLIPSNTALRGRCPFGKAGTALGMRPDCAGGPLLGTSSSTCCSCERRASSHSALEVSTSVVVVVVVVVS